MGQCQVDSHLSHASEYFVTTKFINFFSGEFFSDNLMLLPQMVHDHMQPHYEKAFASIGPDQLMIGTESPEKGRTSPRFLSSARVKDEASQ